MSFDLMWNWAVELLVASALALVLSLALSAGACVLARERESSRALVGHAGVALAVALLLAGAAGVLVMLWAALG